MKKMIVLLLLSCSFLSHSQVVPNLPSRIQVWGSFLDVEITNNTDKDVRCHGWVTLWNYQNNRYMQFLYNEFIWPQSTGRRSYYLGPYVNSFWLRLVNNTITCRIN